MKIAIYRGAFEGQETSVTIHETQGTIYATLEVNARPVPPALQSAAQRSLLEACKQHTKQARATQDASVRHQAATRSHVPTSTQPAPEPTQQPEHGPDQSQTDQQPAGRRFVTRIAADPTDQAQPGTSAAAHEAEQPTTSTKERVILPAPLPPLTVPAQRPSRRMRELIDA